MGACLTWFLMFYCPQTFIWKCRLNRGKMIGGMEGRLHEDYLWSKVSTSAFICTFIHRPMFALRSQGVRITIPLRLRTSQGTISHKACDELSTLRRLLGTRNAMHFLHMYIQNMDLQYIPTIENSQHPGHSRWYALEEITIEKMHQYTETKYRLFILTGSSRCRSSHWRK